MFALSERCGQLFLPFQLCQLTVAELKVWTKTLNSDHHLHPTKVLSWCFKIWASQRMDLPESITIYTLQGKVIEQTVIYLSIY